MKLSSQTIFKVTVFLLGIPAVLLLPVALVAILIRLWRPVGIASFTFAVTQKEMTLIAALLGVFLLLAFLGVALFYRQSRRKANLNR